MLLFLLDTLLELSFSLLTHFFLKDTLELEGLSLYERNFVHDDVLTLLDNLNSQRQLALFQGQAKHRLQEHLYLLVAREAHVHVFEVCQFHF